MAGRIGSPGAMISSPVERIATIGLRQTSTRADADRRQHAGVAAGQHLPGRSTVSPAVMSVPANDTPLPAVTALATRSSRSRTSACSTITTASAPRGTMPPVAIDTAVARRESTVRGTTPVWIIFVAEADARGDFLRRAERVLGDDGEAIDVRAIERRHVDRRDDVGRQHPAEGGVEWDALDAARREVERRLEAALGFVAIEDLEELLLLRHRARRRLRCPAAKPSLSSPTMTKPSAACRRRQHRRAAHGERLDACPSTICTRA